MNHGTAIGINWVEGLEDHPTIYVDGDKIPDVIVNQLIDRLVRHNVDN